MSGSLAYYLEKVGIPPNLVRQLVRRSEIGAPNGSASLDDAGKVPADQLPFQLVGVSKIIVSAVQPPDPPPGDSQIWIQIPSS